MGVDLSLVVRNNFAERENRKATLAKLEAVKKLLDEKFGDGSFSIVNIEEDKYNELSISDVRQEGKDELMYINLYDGFWLIDTAWRYHQYFSIIENRFWLRETMFEYIRLLGATEAYACADYQTWNNKYWKDEDTTFDYWQRMCCKDLGHDIEVLDIQDVINHKGTFYNKEAVYLDTFSDLII